MTSMELQLRQLEEAVKQIKKELRQVKDKAANTQQQQQQSRIGSGGSPVVRAKTTSTISARSGTTVGSGTADIWYLNSSTLTATSTTGVTVRNQFGSSVASGTYIWVAYVDDGYDLISSDC